MVLRQVGMMTLVGGVIGIAAAIGVGPRRDSRSCSSSRDTIPWSWRLGCRPRDRRAGRGLYPGAPSVANRSDAGASIRVATRVILILTLSASESGPSLAGAHQASSG